MLLTKNAFLGLVTPIHCISILGLKISDVNGLILIVLLLDMYVAVTEPKSVPARYAWHVALLIGKLAGNVNYTVVPPATLDGNVVDTDMLS